MSALDIVRAAIPQATEDVADMILWCRTPFPVGAITARDLYRAASRLQRAQAAGHYLCEFCDRMVERTEDVCERCAKALEGNHDDP